MNESEDEEMEDFICDETTSESSDDDAPKKNKKKAKESDEEKSEAVPQPLSPEKGKQFIIIIYHDFLPAPRRGCHVKSDKTHTQSSRYTP